MKFGPPMRDSYEQAMISYCELEEENKRLKARVKELEDFIEAEGRCLIVPSSDTDPDEHSAHSARSTPDD